MKDRHRSKDASRRYHDRVARQYDSMYDDAYWEFHDRLTWETIKPHLPRDASARCADLGCGTGKWGLKLLKSGFATTFVDHSAAMIEQVRAKAAEMGARQHKATLLVADIVDLYELENDSFDLIVAMGDPISICSEAHRAVAEMFRICKPNGVVIATGDNKLAAIPHFFQNSDLDGLEQFIKTGKTNWLTDNERERFELTTFTPDEFRRLFTRVSFSVIRMMGKPVLPIRQYRNLLEDAGTFDRLMQMERKLAEDSSAAAAAGHLQITARKP
jgi:ubiquinone/menaquinone biosynthesis C-methylase UbiE